MKKCPVCGSETFLVSARIVQQWKVDGDGEFMAVTEECSDIIRGPKDDDIWTCSECGHAAEGDEFNVEEDDEEY